MDFNTWMDAVDREIISVCGLGVNDLPDQSFRDWFDDGLTPREAAEYTLENSDAPEELLAMFS